MVDGLSINRIFCQVPAASRHRYQAMIYQCYVLTLGNLLASHPLKIQDGRYPGGLEGVADDGFARNCFVGRELDSFFQICCSWGGGSLWLPLP